MTTMTDALVALLELHLTITLKARKDLPKPRQGFISRQV